MIRPRVQTIQREIDDLRTKIKELEQQKQELENLTIEQQLAEALHARLCHSNHTDACDWEYGSWKKGNSTYAREKYLTMAIAMLDKLQAHNVIYPAHVIYDIIECIK